LKILTFKSPAVFRNWLEKNHAASDGIWLRILKKDSGEESITYGEALDQALCYGWIDGQKKAHDDRSCFRNSRRGDLKADGPRIMSGTPNASLSQEK